MKNFIIINSVIEETEAKIWLSLQKSYQGYMIFVLQGFVTWVSQG